MPKRTFVSGYPWWFVTAFLILWSFFALFSLAASSPGLQFTLVVMIIGISLYRLSSPQVYLYEDSLRITRYGRKVTVLLEHVASVEETKSKWPFRPYSAVLHFTTDTPFGRSLYLGSFDSVPSMTSPWGLEELRQALDSKRSNQAMERTADRSAPTS